MDVIGQPEPVCATMARTWQRHSNESREQDRISQELDYNLHGLRPARETAIQALKADRRRPFSPHTAQLILQDRRDHLARDSEEQERKRVAARKQKSYDNIKKREAEIHDRINRKDADRRTRLHHPRRPPRRHGWRNLPVRTSTRNETRNGGKGARDNGREQGILLDEGPDQQASCFGSRRRKGAQVRTGQCPGRQPPEPTRESCWRRWRRRYSAIHWPLSSVLKLCGRG
ncbi:hypothetical protein M8818_003917 [Zalaria obscura]|uniref:Uncharacterized protein n=1 Tax=Zalaria obscura TaxID=2024903 RepID=A0ACC3SD26_9PEZI